MAGFVLVATIAAALAAPLGGKGTGVPFREDPASVFLAKATLQQYLSRVVRRDWAGARALLHPRRPESRGRRGDRALLHDDPGVQLKTFRFVAAREIEPGVVAIEVGEDHYRAARQGLAIDEPATYLLFRGRAGFRVAGVRAGTSLERADLTPASVRARYPGWVEPPQQPAQARRASAAMHASR